MIVSLSRRDFVKSLGLAMGGLALGSSAAEAKGSAALRPNAFVHVAPDGTVSIVCARSEMGQGVRSSLPALIADELGADLSRIVIVQGDADEAYGNQNTDGSSSVRGTFDDLRGLGAAARVMLVAAAAERWKVLPSECDARQHFVHHAATQRALPFGELVARAAAMPVPKHPPLRPRGELHHLGKDLPLVDAQDLVTGRARFGADVLVRGMLTAVIVRPPVLGGRVRTHDDKAALAVPGVRRVIVLPVPKLPIAEQPLGGIAVVADDTWSAMRAARRLVITWDDGKHAVYESQGYADALVRALDKPSKLVRSRGDVEHALGQAKRTIDAVYRTPHLAHATMEPPAAVADVRDGGCEVWASTQDPQGAKSAIVEQLGIPAARVVVHVTLLGGGFGRKSLPDFIVEAALLSREMKAPVRVQWTRTDDLHHDYYHACAAQRLTAGLDAHDRVTAWRHRTAFPPIGSLWSETEYGGGELGQGVLDLPLDLPNVRAENAPAKAHTRIGWLRSVANIHHAYAQQCFIDELAHARNVDPLAQRFALLGADRKVTAKELGVSKVPNYGESLDAYPIDIARFRNVLARVTNAARWKDRGGRALGLAVHHSFLTYVAVVARAMKYPDGRIGIEEAWICADAGTIINADRVRAQLEGAVIFGLSLALYGEITMKGGATVQDDLRAYKLLRLPHAPRAIHVDIVESDAPSGGVGEPGVPPVAPAVANAIFALTGTRIRDLPLARSLPA